MIVPRPPSSRDRELRYRSTEVVGVHSLKTDCSWICPVLRPRRTAAPRPRRPTRTGSRRRRRARGGGAQLRPAARRSRVARRPASRLGCARQPCVSLWWAMRCSPECDPGMARASSASSTSRKLKSFRQSRRSAPTSRLVFARSSNALRRKHPRHAGRARSRSIGYRQRRRPCRRH